MAVHEDIEDAGPTVVVDNPTTPETPETPKQSMPKTGDPLGWVIPACLVAAAASLAGIALLASRHDDRPDGHGEE